MAGIRFIAGRSCKKFPLQKCLISHPFIPEFCISNNPPGVKTDLPGFPHLRVQENM